MKVLIVNTSERTGGAAVAANRLKNALNNNGVKAKMLVRDKQTDDVTVVSVDGGWRSRWAFLWERWCIFWHLRFSRKHLFDVDIANTGHDITRLPEFREADIIHLHWINQGMLSLRNIRKILESGKPVVWTMHDMWPATSLCHLTRDCEQYKSGCRQCPLLPGGGSRQDLSEKVWGRKAKMLGSFNVEFVAVSTWLADNARASALLANQHISVIPNSISMTRFRLKDRIESRDSLNIQADRHIIVFGAVRIDMPEKGLGYLKKALTWLVDTRRYEKDKLLLLLFGGYRSEDVFGDMPVPHRYLGYLADEDSLSTVYSAADVVVSSSVSETFGQTLIEAQACGCVPVSFNNSGQTDIIRHLETGYLAEYLSAEDLGRGIEWALESGLERRSGRQYVARNFSDGGVAMQYIRLYNKLLGNDDGQE